MTKTIALMFVLLFALVPTVFATIDSSTDELLRTLNGTATDETFNHFPLTNVGVTFQDAIINETTISAGVFAGAQRVQTFNLTNLTCAAASGGCTIAFWANKTDGTDASFWRAKDGGTFLMSVQHTAGRNRRFSGASDEGVDITSDIADNRWAFHTFTIDSSAAKTIYIDGVLNITAAPQTDTGAIGDFSIGAFNEGSEPYTGLMYCFRFFVAAANQSQVDLLYNGGTPTCESLNALENPPTPPAPTPADWTILASDIVDSGGITNFTVQIANSTHLLTNSTTTGSVEFDVANNTNYSLVIVSNHSGGYLQKNLPSATVLDGDSDTLQLTQAIIFLTATEIFTTNVINGTAIYNSSANNDTNVSFMCVGNCTGRPTTVTYTQHNVKAGTTLVTFNMTGGFINRAVNFTVSANTTTTFNTTFWDGLYNLTVLNQFDNASITGWTVNLSLTNGTGEILQFNDTGGLAQLTLVTGENYTVRLISSTDILSNATLDFNATTNFANLTIFTQKANSVHLRFLDEQTRAVLIRNISLDVVGLVSATSTANFTTQNGTLFLSLTPDDYRLDYISQFYDKRSYFFNLTNGNNFGSVDFFLLNSTEADELIMTVKDQDFKNVEGIIIQALRFYVTTNSFEVVEMSITAFDGTARMHLEQDNAFYKFRLLQGSVVRLTTIGSVVNSQHIADGLNFQINTETDTFALVEGLKGVLANVSFNSQAQTFTFAFVDLSSSVDEGCLEITMTGTSGNKVLNGSCSTSDSASIILTYDNSSSGEILAVGKLKKTSADGALLVIDSDRKGFFNDPADIAGTVGGLGLFLSGLLTLAVGLALSFDPKVLVIGVGLGFVIPVMAGLTVFTWSVAVSVFALSLILSALLSQGEGKV